MANSLNISQIQNIKNSLPCILTMLILLLTQRRDTNLAAIRRSIRRFFKCPTLRQVNSQHVSNFQGGDPSVKLQTFAVVLNVETIFFMGDYPLSG